MVRSRTPAALVLALLVVPLVASAQSTGAEPSQFAVRSLQRDGSSLSVRIASVSQPLFVEMARLAHDGQPAARDVPVQKWTFGDDVEVAFALTRDVPSATLVLVYRTGDSKRAQESHALPLSSGGEDDPLRRVDVLDAVRDESDDDVARVLLRSTGARNVTSLRVSLEDAAGARVGVPFVQDVPPLAVGEEAWVTFRLARDASPLTLVLTYANRTESVRVHLRGVDGPDDGPALALSTDFPSRETEPGGSSAFPMRLRNEGAEAMVALRASGLPEGFTSSFVVQGSRVSSFRIPEATSRDITLNVGVPASASPLVGTTLTVTMDVLVDGAVVARAELTLAIVGVGRLEVAGENWFLDATPGAESVVQVRVANTGTAPLLDVAPASTLPTGWRVAFDPPVVARLGPGESRLVALTIVPPADVGPGRYVIDVTASTDDVSARARSLTVSVAASDASKLPWVAAATVGGVLAAGLIVKLKRK